MAQLFRAHSYSHRLLGVTRGPGYMVCIEFLSPVALFSGMIRRLSGVSLAIEMMICI